MITTLNLLFCILESRTRRGYITRRLCPRVRPRGHTTQRASGEIFKLSLPTGQSNTTELKRKVETQTYGWGRSNEREYHRTHKLPQKETSLRIIVVIMAY